MGTTGFGIAAQSLERGAFADLPFFAAKGVPLAAERDESLVSAKRAAPTPEEDSLEAASEREDDNTDAAAFSLVIRPLPVLTRTGIAVTVCSVVEPKAVAFPDPPLLVMSLDVALTVRGVELDDGIMATGPDTRPERPRNEWID